MNRKKEIISLAIGFLGVMVICFFVNYYEYILSYLPLPLRTILSMVVFLMIAVIPIAIMFHDKDKLLDYGFCKEHIFSQILIGIALGIAMSLVFTLLPHLLGFGAYVDNGKRYIFLWQFIYEFMYCIIAVGFTEEFVFRGFLFTKIKRVFVTDIVAVIGSSFLFGLYHVFVGGISQIIITGFLGVFWCFFRIKIKNCSTLSLIFAHGIYDALITVWASRLIYIR